jgi:hypothetical protein
MNCPSISSQFENNNRSAGSHVTFYSAMISDPSPADESR